MLVLRNSKNYIIMMYNDGEKLKSQNSQTSSKPHNCFLCFYTSRLNLPLEDLSANLNVCVRYGFTSNPKSSKIATRNGPIIHYNYKA